MAAQNIDEVVDRLAGIVREAVRAADRVGYFAALYRQVTVEVRAGIHYSPRQRDGVTLHPAGTGEAHAVNQCLP
jgi:hypothetical protein